MSLNRGTNTLAQGAGASSQAQASWWHRPIATLRSAALPRGRIGINGLMLLVAVYLAAGQNQAFWSHVIQALPSEHGAQEYGLLTRLWIVLNAVLLLVMMPFSARRTIKPVLMFLLVAASVCSYFMDSFGVVIDDAMILNALQTDARETGELVGLAMLVHVFLTGIVPAILVARVELIPRTALRELTHRLLLFALVMAAVVVSVLSNYKDVSLWGRTHRHVRVYVNPTYPLYSVNRQINSILNKPEGPPRQIALDATRSPPANGKPRIVIMVVGETARAANFQLAGYARATNPELSRLPGIVSFNRAWSCGTATAVSVPCMFSRLGRASFSRSKARAEENLLDVLQRTGVGVRWRENNSDSKGVALRVPTEDLRRAKVAGLCDDSECYDEVLLEGLDDLVAASTTDRFIVLHLLGSHGPSYYKRYPQEFRKFVPDCAQDDVQGCSRESIVNAYDNTMLYTDHVLARLITLLDRHRDQVEPTMIYFSDHGESLGEDGLYLHGLPYAVAPEEQKHVPFVLWSPAHDQDCVGARRDLPYSHDNLFSTVLGLFDISTTEYHEQADILGGCD